MLRNSVTLQRRAVFVLMMTSLLAGAAPPSSSQNRSKQPRYTVPANTMIRARLDEKMSSKNARVGDLFTSTVVDPVNVRGIEVVPAGSIINGTVTQVKRASRKSNAGSINVAFTSIKLPGGVRYAINGSLASSESADNEGEVKGKSSKKRNAAFIGGGVVTGALFNGVAGAAIGGAIGTAGALLSKGKDVEILPGTEFKVILNRSVLISALR